jgi:23S rRNA pseudouridine2605 synthase
VTLALPDPDTGGLIRLQKALAQAGVGSRRSCEALIAEGRVEVDGIVVGEQGVRINPTSAVVRVDGKRIPTAPGIVVLALNKPRGVVTTMNDERGRPCVGDLIRDRDVRLFHVGRLDADTSGLLLLTNDGELAHRLGHPSHAVAKTYMATVDGRMSRDAARLLRQGIELDDGPAACDEVRIRQALPSRTLVEIVIHEGRNRIVLRMLSAVGYPVVDLVRTRIGPIRLGDLRPGAIREVHRDEQSALYDAVGM